MANSSKENSPTKSNSTASNGNGNTNANASNDAISIPVSSSMPIRIGEGSSSASMFQQLFGGASPSSSSSSPAATPSLRNVDIALGPSRMSGVEEDHLKTQRAPLSAEEKGGDGKAVEKKRKKAEMDTPSTEPSCSLCGKKFGSWKAVFGHLRAHPEREWRGAFPPPKGDFGSWTPLKPSGPSDYRALQVQQLAPTLLNLARETLARMRQESTTVGAESRWRPNINLNKEPASSSSSSPPPHPPDPQGGASDRRICGFDLNEPPLPESDQEEDDDHASKP